MEQLTIKEKASVLNMHIEAECKFNIGFGEYADGIFCGANTDNMFFYQTGSSGMIAGIIDNEGKNGILLKLAPLSRITYEHAIEVGKLNVLSEGFNYLLIGQSICRWLDKDRKSRDVGFEIYQYLIQQRYAVPLFFGVGHSANGKTAIELGLAIDKTTLPQ